MKTKFTFMSLVFSFCLVFAQDNIRKYNLTFAVDPNLSIDRNNIKEDLLSRVVGFQEILNMYDFQLKYSYCFTEEKLQDMEEKALKISGSSASIKNLRNTFDVVNPDLSDDDLRVLYAQIRDLSSVRDVELVSAQPIKPPFDIAPTTPNYISQQTYINANPGVNMQYAWNMDLNGQGIRIRNVEYGFNKNHEEFHQNPNVFLAPGYTVHTSLTFDYTEHGTGTFGVVVADPGNYGVKGLAYGVEEAVLYPEYTFEYGYNRTNAVSLSINGSEQGDIIMYEMQTGGFNWSEEEPNYVPAEYSFPIWNLTNAASDLGIIIVAAAGNGNQNLDAEGYATYMARGNSGAIIVGAGFPNMVHNRMDFSTYGSRVNIQGWGMNVLSTGYGDFSKIGDDFNQQYTMFSGTSSATPIVASCAAVLQSYYHSLTGEYLTSAQMIDVLQTTGTQQGGNTTENIGPLPNMQAAIGYVQTLTRSSITEKPSFNLYPNPFDNELFIEAFDSGSEAQVQVFNALGQKITDTKFSVQATLSTVDYQAGMYFVKLTQYGKTTTYKLVKK